MDLYNRLEELHKEYFNKIRKYLGPTYLRLPSLLSVVLNGCRSYNDILNQVIITRERFHKFREKCTKLEIELRQAEKIKDQIAIINAIENHYNSLYQKASTGKTRILFKMYDVVSKLNPIKMGMAAVELAKEYDIEQDSIIKIPSYYNIWKASLVVQQGLPLLEKVFGKRLNPNIIEEFAEIDQIINPSSIKTQQY